MNVSGRIQGEPVGQSRSRGVGIECPNLFVVNVAFKMSLGYRTVDLNLTDGDRQMIASRLNGRFLSVDFECYVGVSDTPSQLVASFFYFKKLDGHL